MPLNLVQKVRLLQYAFQMAVARGFFVGQSWETVRQSIERDMRDELVGQEAQFADLLSDEVWDQLKGIYTRSSEPRHEAISDITMTTKQSYVDWLDALKIGISFLPANLRMQLNDCFGRLDQLYGTTYQPRYQARLIREIHGQMTMLAIGMTLCCSVMKPDLFFEDSSPFLNLMAAVTLLYLGLNRLKSQGSRDMLGRLLIPDVLNTIYGANGKLRDRLWERTQQQAWNIGWPHPEASPSQLGRLFDLVGRTAIALVWMMPESTDDMSWTTALTALLAAYALPQMADQLGELIGQREAQVPAIAAPRP